LGDTTELDFGVHRDVPDLGPTGNGGGWVFLLHNALLVAAESREVVGLAGQRIHYRPRQPTAGAKKEHSAAKLKRPRESDLWGAVIDQVGPPAEGVELIHVLDRGGDNFEVYCHLVQQRSGWVIRAAQLKRNVLPAQPAADEVAQPLSELCSQLEDSGSYELSLRARPGQPARTAHLQVRVGSLRMPAARHQSPWVRELAPQPIPIMLCWWRKSTRLRKWNPCAGCSSRRCQSPRSPTPGPSSSTTKPAGRSKNFIRRSKRVAAWRIGN
jgi:hypothetical protein